MGSKYQWQLGEHRTKSYVSLAGRAPQGAATTAEMATFHQMQPAERPDALVRRKRGATMLLHETWYSLIGKKLRNESKHDAAEPLPKPWVDLIRHLDEEERKREERDRAEG